MRLRSPPDKPEKAILAAVLEYLRHHPKVAWVERMGITRRRQYRFGFVGCPDVIGQLKDGRFLGVETKTATGVITPDQNSFIAKVTRWGGIAGVCRSIDDCKELLA